MLDFISDGSGDLNIMIQATKDQVVDDMLDNPDQALAVLEDLESGSSEIWKGVLRQLEMIGLTINNVEPTIEIMMKLMILKVL